MAGLHLMQVAVARLEASPASIVERSHADCRKFRCADLFVSTVSPDSETAALQYGRPVSIVPPFTRPDTWTRPPVSRVEWD
jgi:hypothetical protein